jgi:hypothetical protein
MERPRIDDPHEVRRLVRKESYCVNWRKRFRVSLAELIGLVALIAIACRWPLFCIFAIPLVAYRATRVGVPRALAPVLLAVYAPCLIGFFSECSHCRHEWARLWPVIPGGVAWEAFRIVSGLPRLSEFATFGVSAVVTLILISIATSVASRGRVALTITVIALSGVSSLAAFIAYSALRS